MTVSKLLTVVVVGALLVPAHAGQRDLRVVSTPDLLIVDGRSPGSHAQRLTVRDLPADPGLRQSSVTYEESGIARFTAIVSIAESTIEVDGTAGTEPFRMQWVDLGPGVGVETRFSFGDHVFDAFLSQAGPDDPTIEDFLRFREGVERSPGWPAVQEVNLFLRSSSVESPLAVIAALAGYGAGGDASPETSPIRAYIDCLEDSCVTCGACWQNYPWADCYTCPGAPVLHSVISATCYIASTSLCLSHLLLPLPISPDG